MNKTVNFARKIDIFAKKVEKQAQVQLLETKKEFLNNFDVKIDNLTTSEVEQKTEDILKKIRGY